MFLPRMIPKATSNSAARSFACAPRSAKGAAVQIFVWIVVAVSIFTAIAASLYRDGASDISFIVGMSIAAVIAIAIVAPKRFKSTRGASSDWEDDSPWTDDAESIPKADHLSEAASGQRDPDRAA